MNRRFRIVLCLVSLLAACTAAPPRSGRLVQLEEDSGTVLLVDVCLNEDVLGDGDYFVVEEAIYGAVALSDAASQHLIEIGTTVDTILIPFVCGALHDPNNSPKRVAETIDGEIAEVSQPFGITDELKRDPAYLAALQKLATHIFQGALESSTKSETTNGGALSMLENSDELKSATSLVAARTRRSRLLYIGVTGTSLSTEKAATLGVARATVGLAVLATTLGLGSPILLVFVPPGPADARQMVAGLADLRSGALIRSSVVHAGGDPMKPAVLTDPDAIRLLLQDLVFQSDDR